MRACSQDNGQTCGEVTVPMSKDGSNTPTNGLTRLKMTRPSFPKEGQRDALESNFHEVFIDYAESKQALEKMKQLKIRDGFVNKYIASFKCQDTMLALTLTTL